MRTARGGCVTEQPLASEVPRAIGARAELILEDDDLPCARPICRWESEELSIDLPFHPSEVSRYQVVGVHRGDQLWRPLAKAGNGARHVVRCGHHMERRVADAWELTSSCPVIDDHGLSPPPAWLAIYPVMQTICL